MIDNFDDFCLYVYVIVDDIMDQIAPLFKKRGPAPECSDSELITMAIVGECRGWDLETDMMSYWREYANLFPVVPDQSRFNRRRRNLIRRAIGIMKAVGLQRERVLGMLLIENGLMGIVGGLIGVGISFIAIVLMLRQMMGDQFGSAIPYMTAFTLMALCILISLGAALLSVWGASGEKPLNVLRYE